MVQTLPPAFQRDIFCVQHHFDVAAKAYAQADFLGREVAARMAERLDYIKLTPRKLLDLGCGVGADDAQLQRRYPQAERWAVDLSTAMLAQYRSQRRRWWQRFQRVQIAHLVCAEATKLPFSDAQFDFVWSNLLLPWIDNVEAALSEMHRVLEDEGLVMFSTLGPDTLKELRFALPNHAGVRVHAFADMHDVGDMLIQAGFSDPVVDMQMLTLTYPTVQAIWDDLKACGATNASPLRPQGLSGRQGWQHANAVLERSRVDGVIPLSIEIIQGHAWKVRRGVRRPAGAHPLRFYPAGTSAERQQA